MSLQDTRNARRYKIIRFTFILILMLSIAQNVDLYLKYNRLQELYIETITTPKQTSIETELKGKILKIPQAEQAEQAERLKARGINKEFQNLNNEVLKDLENKANHLEKIKLLENADTEASESNETEK